MTMTVVSQHHDSWKRTVPRSLGWCGLFLLVALLFNTGVTSRAGETEEKDRPKVGLVLGGGGAKGFVHIGILRVLEEMRIPIDFISGTSMGSIVAGFYASGMSPDDMEKLFGELDWWEVLKDQTPRRDLLFRRKLDGHRHFGFEVGLKGLSVIAPRGTASGQKFNNLLQAYTLHTSALESFDDLPIPYRALATDLTTGEAVVLDRGNLATAMRASMAVPGAFTPVELDGRILVDGGIVNNIPVDAVKAMGADIVIAVDLGAASMALTSEQLDAFGAILGQTYMLMKRPRDEEQLLHADIVLTPNVGVFSASDFHRSADIVPVGEEVAQDKAEKLAALSVPEELFETYLKRIREVQPVQTFEVASVEVIGNERVDDRILAERQTVTEGTVSSAAMVNRDLARMYGLGDFEQINFRLQPTDDERMDLIYHVTEKAWGPNYLRFGLRLETDVSNNTDWHLLVSHDRTRLNALGAEWSTDLRMGSIRHLMSEFYQPLEFDGRFFIAPSIEYLSEVQDLYQRDERVAEYGVDWFRGGVDLGVQWKEFAELRLGSSFGNVSAAVETGDEELPRFDEQLGGVVLELVSDRLDDTAFPTHGYFLAAEAGAELDELGSDTPHEWVHADFEIYHTYGDHTTYLSAELGSALGGTIPAYNAFLLGGLFSFSGLAPQQQRGSYVGVLSLGYRLRLGRLAPSLGRSVYLWTRADAGNTWMTSDEIDESDLLFGGTVGLGAETLIGPIHLAYGQSEQGFNSFYVSIGTAF